MTAPPLTAEQISRFLETGFLVVEDVLTNVTFGGEDLKTLYVAAGKTLFTTRVEIPGWVVHRQA